MIYLDNSATTKPHEVVLQTFLQVNEHYYANPASIHKAGVEANELLTRAREQIAAILKTEEKNIIFTSGGTESNNFTFYGVAKANIHKGKHIIVSEIEHPSVLEAIRHFHNVLVRKYDAYEHQKSRQLQGILSLIIHLL